MQNMLLSMKDQRRKSKEERFVIWEENLFVDR